MSVKIYFPNVCKAMNSIHSNTQTYILHFFFKRGRFFIPTQKFIEVFFRGKSPPPNKHFLNVSAPVGLNLRLCWSFIVSFSKCMSKLPEGRIPLGLSVPAAVVCQ